MKWTSGSPKKTRQINQSRACSDSEGTEHALASGGRAAAFSERRLDAALRAAAGCASAEIVRSGAAAVRGFVGAALPSDDITMPAIRRRDASTV